MSTLASVIGDNPRAIADWKARILLPDDPLFLFHTQFWGIEDEELLPLSDSIGKRDDMEVDDYTTQGDDGDCYVLDINIPGIDAPSIWVRPDFIRMLKFAEQFYAENLSQPRSPCLVITGQPGIGKTFWRWYVLRVCCAQKRPVIFYPGHICWLFVEEGVFGQPELFRGPNYKVVIWTLVDSGDSDLPNSELTASGSRRFVIYTTSPSPSRWEKLHQTMTRRVCVMNPWTKAEIHRAAPFLAPGLSLAAIDAIYDELGPTPRLCFEKEISLDEYRVLLHRALDKLTLSYLEDLAFRNYLALDEVSHKLYMLRRLGMCVNSVEVEIATISPFVASKIAAWMRELQRHELVRFFSRSIASTSTRKMAGDTFEAYCHIMFSTKIEFDYIPMVRIGGQPQIKTASKSQWHSSHTEFKGSNDSAALEALRVGASAKKVSLSISPFRVVEYSSKEVADGLQIEADVYYIPLKTNQVGIDSFIVHDDTLYLLQMTVANAHGIKEGLLPFLRSLKGLPPQCDWHFIFVMPSRLHILACPVPSCVDMWNLALYSAEVEVKS